MLLVHVHTHQVQAVPPPDFPDYKLEQITKLIKASDRHRMENRQKEFIKQSRKKMSAFNSYASPQFLAKKISDSELPHAKKVEKENDTFVSKSDKYTISIPLDSTGNIMLNQKTAKAFKKSRSKKNAYKFTISLPNKDSNSFSEQAKVTKENTIVYKNYQENTDIAIQVLDADSMRILTIINDADAPTEYIYNVNLPIGASMKKLSHGGINIFDKNKKFMGALTPPWALDKHGKKVPTHYEIIGNKLIQIVDHLNLNVTYPVVADPTYIKSMINSVSWQERKQPYGNRWFHWRITVHPTVLGHSPMRFLYAQEGWDELRRKIDHNWWLNYNTESMREQYFCHVYLAWFRFSGYHLEQWRPNVSWEVMTSSTCNPYGWLARDKEYYHETYQ